jgi:surface antigen
LIARLTALAATTLAAGTLGAGVAQAAPTTYLPPTTHFNVLLGDVPNLSETLAVTPDGQGHLSLRATRSSSDTYNYPIQVFWINFNTGQFGYVAAPYEADAVVTTGKGSVGIGNFVGFPASPSLGTVQS